MFNPRPPAPVSGTTTEATQRLSVMVMAALAQAMPGEVPAGSFATGSNISLGGNSPSYGRYATIFFFGGGYGGYEGGDGLTNGSNIISAARNSSIEVLERSVPLLFTRHAVRENSAGDGRFRGGFGIEVAFHLRDGEAYLSLVGDRGRQGPHGLEGGASGRPADHDMQVGGKTFRPEHLTKIGLLRLGAGDGVHLRTPGGGGFGDPAERAANAREADAADGYVPG
jgi:N-methylhydantoinase B